VGAPQQSLSFCFPFHFAPLSFVFPHTWGVGCCTWYQNMQIKYAYICISYILFSTLLFSLHWRTPWASGIIVTLFLSSLFFVLLHQHLWLTKAHKTLLFAVPQPFCILAI
jgi:hypothetical protein